MTGKAPQDQKGAAVAAAARVTLDWRNATAGEPAPCVLCGRPALCRSPDTGEPCHKTCAEARITAADGRECTRPPAKPMPDRPFWCETCGADHPLREHRLCRERAAERSDPGCDPGIV